MNARSKSLLLLAIVGVAALAAFAWMTRRNEGMTVAVEGRVFEVTNTLAPPVDWQLAPLADVEVLVVWRAEVDAFAARKRVCVRAVRTRSAADGSFAVPSATLPYALSAPPLAISFVYKDGYTDVGVSEKKRPVGPGSYQERIMRKVVEPLQPRDRAEYFSRAADCPPAQ